MEHPGNIQVSLATNCCFIIASQNFQRVSKVPTGFSFSQLISDSSKRVIITKLVILDKIKILLALKQWHKSRFRPGERQIVTMIFQRLVVVVQVEVGVSQLTVDCAQNLQVFCAHLDGRLKKGDARMVISHFTQTLTFQSQFQTRGLHPAGGSREVCEKKMGSWGRNQT